ncbi:MAG: alpha/beta hydrolase [Acidobacteria bacterium]|nr:alpha/beta hydrolase [Acidobacteriota bacterium]
MNAHIFRLWPVGACICLAACGSQPMAKPSAEASPAPAAEAKSQSMLLESKMVQAGPVQLEYFEAGPVTAAHTLVMLHGGSSSARIWNEVQVHLAKQGVRSIAISSRGAGKSAVTERVEDYKPSQYAADLDAAVNELKLERFVLVGHALGTRVSARYLVDHDRGKKVQAYAFMSGAHMLQESAGVPAGQPRPARAEGAVKQTEEQRYAEFAKENHGLPEVVLRAMFKDVEANPPQRGLGQRLEPQPYHVPLLAKLDIPILCIVGDADGSITELTLKAYLGLRPEYRHLAVLHPHVGHHPNAEVPEEIAALLGRFLKAHVPAPKSPVSTN